MEHSRQALCETLPNAFEGWCMKALTISAYGIADLLTCFGNSTVIPGTMRITRGDACCATKPLTSTDSTASFRSELTTSSDVALPCTGRSTGLHIYTIAYGRRVQLS